MLSTPAPVFDICGLDDLSIDDESSFAHLALYADLKGDILSAAGKSAEAKTSYQTALAKIDAKSPYRTLIQVKLDALGGAATAATSAPSLAPAAAVKAQAPAPAK